MLCETLDALDLDAIQFATNQDVVKQVIRGIFADNFGQ